jgi:hypothetical protein
MAQNDYFKIQGTGTTDNGALEIVTGDNGNEPIIFKQISGATQYERMRIDSSGNVGIGTTAPKQKLHVNNWAYIGPDTGGYILPNALSLETQSDFFRIAFDNLRFYDWSFGGDMVSFQSRWR